LVSGDPARTGQILAALLDNALRFTPSGARVEVAARGQDGRAEATVTDTGPGITPEHLPHIFERFYRAEAARSRADGGERGSDSPLPGASLAPRKVTSRPKTQRMAGRCFASSCPPAETSAAQARLFDHGTTGCIAPTALAAVLLPRAALSPLLPLAVVLVPAGVGVERSALLLPLEDPSIV
jgi:Histidine kinase-, DNA gyrase B-, and HSP90-like ATPase